MESHSCWYITCCSIISQFARRSVGTNNMHIAVRYVPSCGWYRLLRPWVPFTTTTKSTNEMSRSKRQACPQRFLFVVVCDRVNVEVISPLFLSGSTLFESWAEASHFSPPFCTLLVMQGFRSRSCGLTPRSPLMLCLVDCQIFATVSDYVSASLQGHSP